MIHADIPVPAIAAAYIDEMPRGDWFLFDMSPLDVTGVPAWKAAFFPADPRAAGCELQHGTGYGETAAQAIIAAVAECFEEVHARLGFARMVQVEGTFDRLVRERGRSGIVDPLELCLPAGSPVGRGTQLRWVEARRWFTREPVLVPVDIAALSADHLPDGYLPFTTLITNGLGAGPTVEWAAAHGLFECLQRDGNGLAYRAMDSGVALTFRDAPPSPVQTVVDVVERAGIELLPKFATDEFGFVNVFVVGADRDPSRVPVPIAITAAGEACDVDRVTALRKATLEYAHARARKAFAFGPLETIRRVMPTGYWSRIEDRVRRAADRTEHRQVEAFRTWLDLDGGELRDLLADPVLAIRASKAFESLATSDVRTPEAKGAEAARRLLDAGLDPLFLDFSPPGGSMRAVRVVVPRLEVETLSYYRIGERNAAKLIAMDSPLICWGEPTSTRRHVRLSAEAQVRLGGAPLLDTAAVDRKVGDLYPLYREPGAHEMLFHSEYA